MNRRSTHVNTDRGPARRTTRFAQGFICACALALLATSASAYTAVPVTNDAYLNYMPSLLQCADDSLMIVYERLDANYENGDLMLTMSDDGSSWSAPREIVATSGNERHPSVVQLGDGSFQLYYLSDETGGYRIHMADSPDGSVWTRRGGVDLGWSSENQVNPTVFAEEDGSLTMSYDVLSNGGYVSHSDDGTDWDHNRTNVSTGSLNRIMRHSDGTYVLSYQRKTGLLYYQIDIFTKTSADRLSWSAENRVTYTQNSHDSFPLEPGDGDYALYFATSTGGDPYDLYSRVSGDGESWGDEVNWLPYSGWDTEPHPITLANGLVALAWPRGTTQTNMQVHFALLDAPTDVCDGSEWNEVEHGGGADEPRMRMSVFPNPFTGATTITLPETHARGSDLCIQDVAGRTVRTLRLPPGRREARWDGRNDAGLPVASGLYFARLSGREVVGDAKLVVLR